MTAITFPKIPTDLTPAMTALKGTDEQILLIIMDNLPNKERNAYTVVRRQAEVIFEALIEGLADD